MKRIRNGGGESESSPTDGLVSSREELTNHAGVQKNYAKRQVVVDGSRFIIII